MVSLFGAASETCLEIADRAPYAQCVRCRCARAAALARRRVSARRARSCGVRDTRGRRATAEAQHAANDALGVCHQRFVLRTAFESPTASKNMAARVCSAVSKWRASTRCVASSPRVRREKKATPRFFLLLCGAGGLKRDGVDCHNRLPHPHWHDASSVGRAATSSPIAGDREVRRARRLKPAAAHCITFADVTSRRRG